jgi:hypothetical protein
MEKETRIAYWGTVLVVVGLTVLFQTLFMHRTFNHAYGIVEEGNITDSARESDNAAKQLMQIEHYLDKK